MSATTFIFNYVTYLVLKADSNKKSNCDEIKAVVNFMRLIAIFERRMKTMERSHYTTSVV